MQDIDRPLQAIPERRLEGAQRFRRQNERRHDRTGEGMRHAETFDADVERDGEFLR